MPISLSVIMPVYNGDKYLSQAIESILQQTFHDFEFIIVDDCSIDKTLDICRDYILKDKRIKLIQNSQHQGLTRSLNKALKLSQGKYIARMDADDVSQPNRFESQIRFLEANPEIGLLGTFYQELDSKNKVLDPIIQFPVEPIIIKWRLCFENPIPHPPIIVKKDLMDQVGGYDEQWATSQDYDLFTRLSKFTKLANYPDVLFYWRIHNKSISFEKNDEQRLNAMLISQKYVSEVLNETVPLQDISLLWNRKQNNLRDVLQVSHILHRLCLKILQEGVWTNTEINLLREYVTRKIFYYLRPFVKQISVWGKMPRLFFLSPETFLSLIIAKVNKQTDQKI